MKQDFPEHESHKTLATHLKDGLRRRNAAKPFSFYLLVALLIIVVLSVQLPMNLNNPKRLLFFLILDFIFLFAVLVGAIVDFFDIAKKHFSEREKLFEETLGRQEFVSELRNNIENKRKE